MSDLNIVVILGSTRPGRNGQGVADWVVNKAAGRSRASHSTSGF
jgi:NAD(P)H-dependent FMN reductase